MEDKLAAEMPPDQVVKSLIEELFSPLTKDSIKLVSSGSLIKPDIVTPCTVLRGSQKADVTVAIKIYLPILSWLKKWPS